MELLLLALLIILLVVGKQWSNKVQKAFAEQYSLINRLREELQAFQTEFRKSAIPPPPVGPPAEIGGGPSPVVVAVPPSPPPVAIPEPRPAPVVREETLAAPAPADLPPSQPEPLLPPPARPQPVAPPLLKPSYLTRFLAENPDVEKFIGENLINKIGIAILVAGIGYFVKFAIDQDWINELGRVMIGILAGGLLLGVAHRLRNRFTAFSSVLVAGGLSVLYFTIAIAFSEYKIFSQTAAFLLMVLITGFAVLLSIAYNRAELAVMSIIGGFSTPFLVSSGAGNYVVLFSYLLILDGGMLVLAYFKKWTIVHWVAYGFTVILFGTWLGVYVLDAPSPPSRGALLFATLFYAIFMAMNLLYNLKNQQSFSAVEILLLLSNTACYYAAGMLILTNVNQGAYQGVFTAGLAGLNFGLVTFLYRRKTVDRTLIYLLIGLVITFASLTIPVQLTGNFITMFWALEAVLLLWLAQRSGLRLLATGSVIITGLMLVSLTLDWSVLYVADGGPAAPVLPIIVNKAFITSLLAIASLVVTRLLLRQQTNPFSFWIGQLSVAAYQRLITYLTGLVAYAAGAWEVDYQTTVAYGFSQNNSLWMGGYNMTFAAGLLLLARYYAGRTRLLQAALLGLLALLCYLTIFDPSVHDLLEGYFRGDEASMTGYWVHYISLAGVVCILVLLAMVKQQITPLPVFFDQVWPWFLGVMVVYVASSELFSHVVYAHFSGAALPVSPAQKQRFTTDYYALTAQINQVGLPILWGVCAFIFMYVGLTRRNRQFRILSLSLFALTLLKLFLYDLQGISEGGRIAAFISLGALLLIISFMYQRIKHLILATDTPHPDPTDV